MALTAEHRAAVHDLVRDRLQAGRPVWDHTIDLSEVFGDVTMPFASWREEILGLLRSSPWADDPAVSSILDHLADAADLQDFNHWWDLLYDQADHDRVKILTRPTPIHP